MSVQESPVVFTDESASFCETIQVPAWEGIGVNPIVLVTHNAKPFFGFFLVSQREGRSTLTNAFEDADSVVW